MLRNYHCHFHFFVAQGKIWTGGRLVLLVAKVALSTGCHDHHRAILDQGSLKCKASFVIIFHPLYFFCSSSDLASAFINFSTSSSSVSSIRSNSS